MNVSKSFQVIILISTLLCLSSMVQAQNIVPQDYRAEAKNINDKATDIWNSTQGKPQNEVVETFKTQIIPMMQQSAEMGYPRAMVNLGTIYYEGYLGSPDQEQGVMWWRKGWENGFSDVYDRLSQAGCSDSDLMTWLIDSADKGNPDAQLSLGFIYDLGSAPCNRKDKEKAIKYCTLAAENEQTFALGNNNQAWAMSQLGYIYMFENETGGLDEKGKPWLEKAAAAGWDQAMVYLAAWYLDGDYNPQKAVELLQKAAKKGNTDAIEVLDNLCIPH